MTGPVPPQLASLVNLKGLYLGGRADTGGVGSLANLTVLELTGPIPPQLASLVNLKGLYLWGNELTGPIPAELGSLASLEELYLSDNELTGPSYRRSWVVSPISRYWPSAGIS